MILGIDPGLHGAIVCYNPTNNTVAAGRNIPILDLVRNGKNKKAVDFHALLRIMTELSVPVRHIFLELVGAMPGQGTSSMFSFGRTFGAIEMAVVAQKLP